MANNLKNQIAEVEQKLADTQQMNIELTLENETLRLELQMFKNGSPPIVRKEDCLAVEGGEDDMTVVGQGTTSGTNGSATPVPVIDLNKVVPNERQWTDPAPDFISNDPIVQQCRPNLANLPFGWMKLSQMKKAKYYPAFVYPTDEDGKRRAQWVTPDGYVSDLKKEFYEYHRALPVELKKPSEVNTLKKFNKKFGFDLS